MAAPNSLALPTDTIYALSSGPPPAAIAVVRISGPDAGATLQSLAGRLPEPRQAGLRSLRDRGGSTLDHALTLWFPGPNTATGEDLAELHLHGGRAVVDAVQRELAGQGLRSAEPGEFTRRAFLNGRIDLAAAEGLADLLSAETESQRREALRRADGALGRMMTTWANRITMIAAELEAAIDYDGDVEFDRAGYRARLSELRSEIQRALEAPPVERLRDGVRIAIVGPPNAGKSTLFNALIGDDAAIVSEIAGTTRDVIERTISLAGRPVVLIDTAGLREAIDPVEKIGIERAQKEASLADIVIDLAGRSRGNVLGVSAKCDVAPPRPESWPLSAVSGAGMAAFREALIEQVDRLLPVDSQVALNRRHRDGLRSILALLGQAGQEADDIVAADHVQIARREFDALIGGAGLEDMLDALFGRFCLGK